MSLTAQNLNISILVAEDDAMMSRVTRDMLTMFGMRQVDVVRNGQEAIQALHKKNYDILICDWMMQPMSGLELTYFIRTDATSPNRLIPIIMLTGKGERRDIELARDAGINEYLVKPFTAATLAARIRAIVDEPRQFVLAKSYKGPDRRRRDIAPPEGVDRRKRKRGKA